MCIRDRPNFELHDIYRALEVIAKETDFIQAELYKNSLKVSKRNTTVLYYDCTNYFFEIEQEKMCIRDSYYTIYCLFCCHKRVIFIL